MASVRKSLQTANLSVSEFAKKIGVRRTAVVDYLARRWSKCGSDNRRRIHEGLIAHGVIPAPDKSALARKRMRQFHRDAGNPELYRALVGAPRELVVADPFVSQRFTQVL